MGQLADEFITKDTERWRLLADHFPRGACGATSVRLTGREGESLEGQAHHGDDEGHPAAVGVGALGADPAESEFGEQGEEDSGGEGPAAPFQELIGSVVGSG